MPAVRRPSATSLREYASVDCMRERCARFRDTSKHAHELAARARDRVRHHELIVARLGLVLLWRSGGSGRAKDRAGVGGARRRLHWFSGVTLNLDRAARLARRKRLFDECSVRMPGRQADRPAPDQSRQPGSVCCIAGLLKSNSPEGLNSATASSRCSTADCRFAFCPASSVRSAESC